MILDVFGKVRLSSEERMFGTRFDGDHNPTCTVCHEPDLELAENANLLDVTGHAQATTSKGDGEPAAVARTSMAGNARDSAAL